MPVTDELQVTVCPVWTEVGEQPSELTTGTNGAGVTTAETEIDFEPLSQPALLQTRRDNVFEPTESNDVANVLPLPEEGEPPEADHERDVTVPLIDGEQLTV